LSWVESLSRIASAAAGRAPAPPAAWIGAYAADARVWLAHVERRTQLRPRLKARITLHAPHTAAAVDTWLQGYRAPGAAVNALLAPQDYQLFQLDVPAVPREEWPAATRWRLKDLIDIQPELAQLACVAIPADDGADSSRMFTVVTQQDRIRREMLEYRRARGRLRAIDVPEMALRNLLRLTGEDPAQALLFINEDEACLVMLWRGDLAATRRFDIGLQRLGHADPEDHFALIERLALEFQRTADAFARQFTQGELRELWLCAGSAAEEMAVTLQGMLAVPVRIFRASEHLDGGDECPDEPGLQLALGAALRDESEAG
jgi:MSHA biogenesis protein MshI